MNQYNIILIEDNDDDVSVVKQGLNSERYNIIVFTDGLIAWEYVTHHHESINVIILGKTIPSKNGMELLEDIKHHPDLKKKPVIVQTIDTSTGSMNYAIQHGAQFYLTKPLTPKTIAAMVKASIRSRQDSPEREQMRKSFVDKIAHQRKEG